MPPDERGIPGEPGQTGETGETGQTGTPGATGASGATGATGKRGETGTPGIGTPGRRGDVGERGEVGESGVRGERGRSGSLPSTIKLAFGAIVLTAFLVISGLAFVILQIQEQADKNKTALEALCASRHDLDQRIAATAKVLKENEGDPIFGIPRQLILDGQARSKETRQNLNVLHC